MQTILIRKKQYVDVPFNPYGFEKDLMKANPELHPLEISELTRRVNDFYQKMSEFDLRDEDHLLKRNIVRQQLVYSNVEFGNKNAVESDVVVIGKERNWPRFKNIIINSFENKNFIFKNLDSPVDLLQSHRLATIYMYSMVKQYNADKMVELPLKISKSGESIIPEFNMGLLSGVVDLAKMIYGVKLNTQDYYYMSLQLTSMGLIDAVYYAIHNMKDEMNKLINNKLNYAKFDLMNKNEMKMRLLRLSEFNLAKHLAETEMGIKTKAKSLSELISSLKGSDKKKLESLMKERTKQIYAPPCAHNKPYEDFIRLKTFNKKLQDTIKGQLMSFLEYDAEKKQYFCNTCGQRVLCQHTLDLLGKTGQDKMKIIEQYKNLDDSSRKYSYCNYCAERIFRNELDEIMTTVKFDELVRSREEVFEGNTQISAFDNGLYFGVANLINSLKFDYEFVPKQLIKTIMNKIYNIVNAQIALLNLGDDLDRYEEISAFYGYTYSAIYMMRAFLVDPKITTPDKTPKNQNDYAKYFASKIDQRFARLTTPENTKRLIYKAFVDLKPLGDLYISHKTESDHVLEILQNPYYITLYKMHLCAHPDHTPVDAFKYIVTNPNPRVYNFLIGAKIPTKNVSQNKKDIYTYWMDFNDPRCYIFKSVERPTGATKDLVFDPSLHNKLFERMNQIDKEVYIKHYIKLIKSRPTQGFSRCYGANYIYDEEGDIMVWNDKYEWTSKSGKTTKLSDIKRDVDASTPKKIEARNKKINFKPRDLKPIGTSSSKKIDLENAPEFIFNNKIFGIISKIDQKFSPNILEYLGRTDGYEYADLIRGVIPGVENYSVGSTKVKYYCQLFIEKYCFLKYNSTNQENIDIIEKAEINYNQLAKIADELPELDTKKYYQSSSSLNNLYEPKEFYYWQVNAFAEFITIVSKTKLGIFFLAKFLKMMIIMEKKFSLPNPRKLAGGFIADDVEESEYDEVKDTKPSNDDNDIDYEQDEDDINDYDDR